MVYNALLVSQTAYLCDAGPIVRMNLAREIAAEYFNALVAVGLMIFKIYTVVYRPIKSKLTKR